MQNPPKCTLCGEETLNNNQDEAFPNHDRCVITLYRKMKRLHVIDVKRSNSGIGYMWKPTKAFQKIIDEKLNGVPDNPAANERERKDILILIGTLSAIKEYVPKKDIKPAEYLYLTAMVFVELMKNVHGNELPGDKSFLLKMKELSEQMSSFQLSEEMGQFVKSLKRQLDLVS